MIKPLLAAVAVMAAAGGTAASVYYAVPRGEEEVVQQVQTPTPEASATLEPSPSTVPTATTPASSPSPTAEPSPEAVPADWKTYDDPVLDFSLRYPPDLVLTDLTGPSPAGGLNVRALQFRSASDRSRSFTMAIVENSKGLSLDQWVHEFTACLPKTIERGTIAGNAAVFCTSQPEEILEAAVVFEHTGQMILITSIMPAFGFESEFELVIASLRL